MTSNPLSTSEGPGSPQKNRRPSRHDSAVANPTTPRASLPAETAQQPSHSSSASISAGAPCACGSTSALAEFLRREIYVHDGINVHSEQHRQLPPRPVEDPFVASVLAPQHALVVIIHDEAESLVENPFERALIAPVLEALVDLFDLGPEHGMGVVVPHRAQRGALAEALPQLTILDPKTGAPIRSAVDTVERFQGDEREAIMVSATESDPQYLLVSGDFLLDPRRLTVALSRAKRKMILVASRSVFNLFSADEETFANAQLWKNLLRFTCTELLWEGEREGHAVQVWVNAVSCSGGHGTLAHCPKSLHLITEYHALARHPFHWNEAVDWTRVKFEDRARAFRYPLNRSRARRALAHGS